MYRQGHTVFAIHIKKHEAQMNTKTFGNAGSATQTLRKLEAQGFNVFKTPGKGKQVILTWTEANGTGDQLGGHTAPDLPVQPATEAPKPARKAVNKGKLFNDSKIDWQLGVKHDQATLITQVKTILVVNATDEEIATAIGKSKTISGAVLAAKAALGATVNPAFAA